MALSSDLKEKYTAGVRESLLPGRVMALLFEKPSLRTRLTFELAIKQLGGDPLDTIAKYKKGDPVTCEVMQVQDNGIEVKIAIICTNPNKCQYRHYYKENSGRYRKKEKHFLKPGTRSKKFEEWIFCCNNRKR